MSTSDRYTLTINLPTLQHLVNLYSNVPAVLSEVVANAWDADATRVDIVLDSKRRRIEIRDDGHGMDVSDANAFFLKVGYRRRDAGRHRSPRFKRSVMGRKGIGKLALFAIADIIEVRSVKTIDRKKHKSGFVLNRADIEKAIKNRAVYHPKPLAANDITHRSGTLLVLRKLRKNVKLAEQALRTRIARRFSVLAATHKFSVRVNGQAISVKDRGYLKKLQYLWTLGKVDKEMLKACTSLDRRAKVSDIVDTELGYRACGWVGTFDERRNIEPGNNSIVVLARGKLVHEDLLGDLPEGGIYTKYIIGEIEANFLDLDDREDIMTSDRQRIREDDPRFVKLRDFVRSSVLKEIERKWRNWRADHAQERATAIPAVKEWVGTLTPDRRNHARRLFERIESLRIENDQDRRELYRHGILAFEKLVLKDNLSALAKFQSESDFSLLAAIFADIDELEAFEYYHIVKGRVEVLKKFEKIVPSVKERVIQEHIFDHLWLLDPSWERASSDARMEQKVTTEFRKADKELTQEERDARLDLRYRTAAGKHIIVELKKYGVSVKATALVEQIRKYGSALTKCLDESYPDETHHVEIICILGRPPTPRDKASENDKLLKAVDARFITYDTLIKQTKMSYADYLDKAQKMERIVRIVDSL